MNLRAAESWIGMNMNVGKLKGNQRLLVMLGVATGYFLAGKLGLSLAYVNASASAVWPPTGISFAAFLLLGRNVWPAILVGAFLVNITTTGAPFSSIGVAVGNTLEGLLGASMVQRWANGPRVFERAQDIFKFVLLSAMLSTTVSATLGVTSVSLDGLASWEGFGLIWITWWLGDAVGAVIVAPLLILWIRNPRIHWTVDQILEFLFLLGFLLVVSQLSFGVWQFMTKRYPLFFLCIPPLVWTAFRFGPRETATVTTILSAIAIKGTLEGLGSFVQGTLNESLLLLQSFMGINSIMGLVLAAVVSERRNAESELEKARSQLEERVELRTKELVKAIRELQIEIIERGKAEHSSKVSEKKFRDLLESAPDAMIMVNGEGRIQLMNSQSEAMFGYKREELLGTRIEKLLPVRFQDQHFGHRALYFKEPRVRPMGLGLELFAIRRNGSEFPVEISLSPLMTPEGILVTAAIRDITERKRLQMQVDRVQQERTRDMSLLAASVQQAQEEERHRIARELHDDLGQRLSGMKLNLQVIEGSIAPKTGKARSRIKDIKQQIDSMITEIRKISSNLRPTALDDFGLVVALQLLCKEFEKASGLPVKFSSDGLQLQRLGEQIEIALYRILQEALTNVAKHASASAVSVTLEQKNRGISLTIEDDGAGFENTGKQSERGLGLMSIRERSEHLGGTCVIDSAVNHGARINVKIPLPA